MTNSQVKNKIKKDRSRGFGFITYKEAKHIENLLNEQPHFIDGKKVECKPAIPKDQINYVPEFNYEENNLKITKIFVGGLPPKLDENQMFEYFCKFGEIEQCVIMHDKPSGKSRGNRYYFIKFFRFRFYYF